MTEGPFTAFLIAGEESGDHLGARLMEAMIAYLYGKYLKELGLLK